MKDLIKDVLIVELACLVWHLTCPDAWTCTVQEGLLIAAPIAGVMLWITEWSINQHIITHRAKARKRRRAERQRRLARERKEARA